MYLYRDEAERLTAQMRQDLSTALVSSTDQLLSFLQDSDWSMVIKLHAALEAATTQAIVAHINQDSLREVIERLPLSDNQTGKGRIAVDLGVISKSQFTFIRKLSELRNKLVHQVENISFDTRKYFEGLDKQQLQAWKNAIAWENGRSRKDCLAEILEQNPKVALFLSVFAIITLLAVAEQEDLARRKIDYISERTMQELFGATSNV
ncbi:hypothetical protein [Pseudomonas putida]|uniref:hypothetical protein n=1 Tax=Pseudomonas putida TaxID=303 RepID=UPI0016257335|nr:hypothetical protein [Pseudomonas putida]QNG10633.1 hypothetical protein GPM17_20345 [Pseudomonas putida]HDS1059329.1 hypothetical protein [Pseudomonas putida]